MSFTVTVVSAVNPVPFRLTAVAALIGPAVGEIEVRVGTGGFVIFTVIALESDGVALGVVTFTLAVPAAVRSAAGTVAYNALPP
jgi:hypothetical protein